MVGAIEVGLPDHYVQRIAMVMAIADPDSERDRLERAVHGQLASESDSLKMMFQICKTLFEI